MQLVSQEGKKLGFIDFKTQDGKHKLDDVWFMVGSRCNLTCTHCYVASSPTNDALQQMTLEDIEPKLTEAKELGVSRIYFTGGEPFICQDIIKMIVASLKVADVTVLTNATFPIERFIPQFKELAEQNTNKLSFRVSLDHYDREKHDAIRGEGMFSRTVMNVKKLCAAGFKPIITATAVVYEGSDITSEEAEKKFIELFKADGSDVDVKILPYNLEMGANLDRIEKQTPDVFISEDCMKSRKPSDFQCHNGRTLQKIDGEMKVYPCPIIYNDKNYEMGKQIRDSLGKVYLSHKACFDFCYKGGGSCTN